MSQIKIVSIDFDGTLDRADVQDYVQELIGLGIKVQVLTAREKKKTDEINLIDNSDLWDVVNQIGLTEDDVIFTEYDDKYKYLMNSAVILHLDDQQHEIKSINRLTNVRAVDVNMENYKERCDKILGL